MHVLSLRFAPEPHQGFKERKENVRVRSVYTIFFSFFQSVTCINSNQKFKKNIFFHSLPPGSFLQDNAQDVKSTCQDDAQHETGGEINNNNNEREKR